MSLAYQDFFHPGSTFKVVTATAAYQYAPKLVNTPMPFFSCIPADYFGDQSQARCATTAGARAGGPSPRCSPPRATPASPCSAPRWARSSMQAEAQSFGFNQQPPLDLPHSPFELSQFLQAGCWRGAQIFLAYSSIGQDCTIATPLQMAMVAAGIANGGVVMTPHVMYEIRDSQNELVPALPAHRLAPGRLAGHGERR